MEHSVVWVHGIGDHAPGYSDEWRRVFNPHLNFPDNSYAEVLWESVFDTAPGPGTRAEATTRAGQILTLTPEEAAEAERVREELTTFLQARESALRTAAPDASTRAGAEESEVWVNPAEADVAEVTTRGGFFTWLLNPDEYLGDFVKYLVSRPIRSAVKERFKEQMRLLEQMQPRIAVVAHSWGTVVAYDSLLDLSGERPDLEVRHLFTLGSPLWMVRRVLEDRSGRKPPNVDTWINVNARGDLVGSWLRPAYGVDEDFQVPHIGDSGPH
ncbi:MAG TPA: hypothetical protein VGW38_09210, partial [Chloroflexota bacterium]|nr:hypothetical protein [Chloroflexota bacterium]